MSWRSPAAAQLTVYDPANHATSLVQLVQLVEELVVAYENLATLNPSARSLQGLIDESGALNSHGDAISVTSPEVLGRALEVFPGAFELSGRHRMDDLRDHWATVRRDTAAGALGSAQKHYANLTSALDFLEELRLLSATTFGSSRHLQLEQSYQSATAGELAKITHLLGTLVQIQATETTARNTLEGASEKTFRGFMTGRLGGEHFGYEEPPPLLPTELPWEVFGAAGEN